MFLVTWQSISVWLQSSFPSLLSPRPKLIQTFLSILWKSLFLANGCHISTLDDTGDSYFLNVFLLSLFRLVITQILYPMQNYLFPSQLFQFLFLGKHLCMIFCSTFLDTRIFKAIILCSASDTAHYSSLSLPIVSSQKLCKSHGSLNWCENNFHYHTLLHKLSSATC